MALHEWLTSEVREGPAGPRVGAFFDLDGTLIAGFSIAAFWRDRILSRGISLAEIRSTLASVAGFRRGTLGFSGVMATLAGFMRGISEKEFEELGERLFEEELATLIYPESRALVETHLERGHTVAIISSATRYQIDPLARDLGVELVVCSELEVEEGRFTGRVAFACDGRRKAEGAERLSLEYGLDLDRSYFYTDSYQDLPLLQAVGKPRPVNPDSNLARVARRRAWPMARFESRGRARPIDVIRTGLALTAMSYAPLLALPGALLNRDWRHFVNASMSASADLCTAIAGVELRVEGEQNLWLERPVVFIFNHQSNIDAVLVTKMVRRDVIAVGKKELRVPLFGRIAEWAGTVFIDRSDPEQAIEALRPVVDEIRAGRSLVIAPEGTRSPTPRLGPFKKGPFHIAMQAGVPVVPIVLRNALDAMPKHAFVVRPATVEAVVLPPIPTDDWTAKDLDERITEVREQYLKVLNQA